MRSQTAGWTVAKNDTEPCANTQYRRLCGTRVTSPDGRVMDWWGRMTKAEAIRQTLAHWDREERLDAHAAMMEGSPEECKAGIARLAEPPVGVTREQRREA